MQIRNFQLNYESGFLLPSGMSWDYKDKNYYKTFPDRGLALLLNDQNGIAVIEAPSMIGKTKAYILNPDESIRWELSELVKEKYPNNKNHYILFSDVYYNKQTLYFFINTGNDFDERFSFDPETGTIGSFIPSY